MTQFVEFTEYNDHEGETWAFWLQVNGNEDELNKFAEQLDEEDLEEQFSLNDTTLDEHDVDVLVKHGGGGYMNNHTKVTGVFRLVSYDDILLDDVLYKGGIRDFFKNG